MLTQLGWDDGRRDEVSSLAGRRSTAVPGRVVRSDSSLVRVATEGGEIALPRGELVVGDWVLTDGQAVAHALERRTELARQSSGRDSREQVLAANVDVVLAVEPLVPAPNVRRIERMLTLAWASGAVPVVLLAKADLTPATVDEARATVQAVALGVDVLAVSSATGAGLDGLRAHLGIGRTFVLLGPSGAGKSTLINHLAGRPLLATADVRGDGRGRHTTSHRELVPVEGAGLLIDTPGIRAVGMTAEEDGLQRVFEDIVALAQACRYSDCSHRSEPGCAVQDAVELGELDFGRLESYQRLQREVARQASRKQSREHAEERRDTSGRRRAKNAAMRAKGR